MPEFRTTRAGYLNLWGRAKIRPDWQLRIDKAALMVRSGESIYRDVETQTGVPWMLIGALHYLESGCRWDRHLHNGDPLTARTRRVPAGRPTTGRPPFSWRDSAVDALRLKKLDQITGWPIERMLYEAERYNGFGYFRWRINSPYLWSGTDLYVRGKYIADGKYSASTVSAQVGVVPILKAIIGDKTMFLTQLITIAPLLIEAITDSGRNETLARSALAEAYNRVAEGEPATADTVVQLLPATPFSKMVDIVIEAERAFAVLTPDAGSIAPAPQTAGSQFDALFGVTMTGWKTYITIGLAVIVNGLPSLGIASEILTPQTVSAINVLLGGFGTASAISKIERLFRRPPV